MGVSESTGGGDATTSHKRYVLQANQHSQARRLANDTQLLAAKQQAISGCSCGPTLQCCC